MKLAQYNGYLVNTVGTDGWEGVVTVLGVHPCVSNYLWVNCENQ